MRPHTPKLHVITDEVFQERYTHVEIAAICARAGAGVVQYREKRDFSSHHRTEIAEAMMEQTENHGTVLVVNDFVDVAKSIGAPGVHLGQGDQSVIVTRRELGDSVLIGGTANSIQEAVAMDIDSVDYLGVGPIFGTQSKANPAPVMGTKVLAEICALVSKPVIAIGNIQLNHVPKVLDAGAHGVAVLSAITCAEDVGAAASQFCEKLNQ